MGYILCGFLFFIGPLAFMAYVPSDDPKSWRSQLQFWIKKRLYVEIHNLSRHLGWRGNNYFTWTMEYDVSIPAAPFIRPSPRSRPAPFLPPHTAVPLARAALVMADISNFSFSASVAAEADF